MSMYWPQVDKLKDKESLDSETLNRPVDQLATRTEYLKSRLSGIVENGYQSSLVLTDVKLLTDDESGDFQVGNIVYRAGGIDGGFRKAQAKMHLFDDFRAADSAFVMGVLVRVSDSTGDVLIYGKIDLSIDGGMSMLKSVVLQSGEKFRSGRYYLSATEAGKLTASPNGPLIFVCSIFSDDSDSATDRFANGSEGFVNPQFLDIGTSHVHRAYRLVARPAGDIVDGKMVGYLPTGVERGYDDQRLPSLVFGGAWESEPDVEYEFSLSEASAWGSVTLSWTKNGDASSHTSRDIPAPGVYVDVDNGLKVKVMFPEATSARAFTTLSESQRKWTLTFPLAGRGWKPHSVEAVSPDASATTDDCDVTTPVLKVCVDGRWPEASNTVFVTIPSKLSSFEFDTIDSTDGKDKVYVDGTGYQFVEVGTEPDEGFTAVTKAATVAESLENLAKAANGSLTDGKRVAYHEDTLYSCGAALTFPEESGRVADKTTGLTSGIDVVGSDDSPSVIPVVVVSDADGESLGIVNDLKTFTPAKISDDYDLSVTVYAEGATREKNVTCEPDTTFAATAFDEANGSEHEYSMGLHTEVNDYWPPVPAQAVGLFVNGVEMENAALFEDNPTYKVGRKTVYWMDGDSEHLPWPATCKGHDYVLDPSLDKTMVVYFVVGFQCASGPVTSLVPAENSPIKMTSYGTTDEAYTGDLTIDLDLDLSVNAAGVQGYQVAKRFKGGKLLAGPVVERVKAGPGIAITQQAGCPDGQGTVTIGLDDGSLRGVFNEVALENAKQEKLGLFPYVSLLGWGSSGNIPSAFTVMMRVPSNLSEDDARRLQLRFVMFGASAYEGVRQAAAGIQLEYNILPDYTDDSHLSLKSGLLIPNSPRVINVPFGHQEGSSWKYVAYDPFVATTDSTAEKVADVRVPFSSLPIPDPSEFVGQRQENPVLKPGYLVALRVSRTSMGDTVSYSAYTGQIGFLSLEWTLEEA